MHMNMCVITVYMCLGFSKMKCGQDHKNAQQGHKCTVYHVYQVCATDFQH